MVRAKWGVGAQFIKSKIDVSLRVKVQIIELNQRGILTVLEYNLELIF